MKKIIKICALILFVSVIRINGVKAEYFYEDNWITGIYAKYEKGDFTKSQLMRFIRRKSDNKSSYCLTPEEFLYEDSVYTSRISNPTGYLKITDAKYKRISQIAYFGYNYNNHSANKWYAITQFMIWKEMEPTASIYFTDSFAGNKITRFTNEMSEIESLISNYNLLPKISNYNLGYGKVYYSHDSNEILNKYDVISNDLDVSIIDNDLRINANKKGTFKVRLIRKEGNKNESTTPYTSSKGQDILVSGGIERPYKDITINITSGDLTIKKVDRQTNGITRGEATVVGAKYQLLDVSNNVIDTVTINSKGLATIKDLTYGSYKLKEIEAPKGYQLDSNTYQITIDEDEETFVVKEDIIESKLIINKILNDTKEKEEDVTFSIYDNKNNLVDKITTDKEGIASTYLTYGTYKIVQENTILGYRKVKDFNITIDNINDKIINLEDERIVTNLKLVKKDYDNHKSIVLSNASFKIYDLLSNEYLSNKDNDIFVTDNNGEINIIIKGGKYKVEEVKSPIGYILSDNVEFIIDENTTLINNTFDLDIYNKKQYGIIEITKKGKLKNNNQINLQNVSFNIYASEDIITSDNVIHYKEGDLIDTVKTDINGVAIIDNLYIGKYYIEEVSTLNNFILDKNKYVIDLFNDTNLVEYKKGITITNDEVTSLISSKTGQDNEIIKLTKPSTEILNAKDLKTVYPKTDNKEKAIDIIIIYLVFIGFILMLVGFKHEK